MKTGFNHKHQRYAFITVIKTITRLVGDINFAVKEIVFC
jgi:hypothetical protein